jgi:magnesium transporter
VDLSLAYLVWVQVDEHTTLLLEAARSEVDPLAVRRASIRRSATLRSRRSHRSAVRSHTSSGLETSDGVGSIPRVTLPDHITGEEDLEDFDLDFDDVASTKEIVQRTEEPGLDSLRGTFGAIGTIIRAKRRARALSAASHVRAEPSTQNHSQHSRLEGGFRGRSGSGGSGYVRPSWLPHGAWNTPRGSRFQPMEMPDDIPDVPPLPDLEKGIIEMRENDTTNKTHELGSGNILPPVFGRSRSPSLTRSTLDPQDQSNEVKRKKSGQSVVSEKPLSIVESRVSSRQFSRPDPSVRSRGHDTDDDSFKSIKEKDVTDREL